jgi:hypothetical protein
MRHGCAFPKPCTLENYVIPGSSDILKFMTGWVLQRFSAARAVTCRWNFFSCAISSEEQTLTGLSDAFANEKDTQRRGFLARDRVGAAPGALIEVTEICVPSCCPCWRGRNSHGGLPLSSCMTSDTVGRGLDVVAWQSEFKLDRFCNCRVSATCWVAWPLPEPAQG